MNKTRRRAVQKHRAKDQKFAARRKAEQAIEGGARARAQMQAPPPPTATSTKPKPASRSRADATPKDVAAAETTSEDTEQSTEQASE